MNDEEYICIIDWNGRNFKTWIFKKTKTWITFQFTSEFTEYWTWFNKWDILKCKFDNKCKHCLRDWGDWTYTIYPNRWWVPYHIKPIIN